MFVTAMKAPDMKPKLDQQGLIPVNLCGADFGSYLRGMVADYQRIIKQAGIKVGTEPPPITACHRALRFRLRRCPRRSSRLGWERAMCCSSTAAKSPMAQFLKSQSPDELWKAALKPKDPLKPADCQAKASRSRRRPPRPALG